MLSVAVASVLLSQAQQRTVPPIDWNNLPYQNQVKEMADRWRAKYHLPGVWCAFVKNTKTVAEVAIGFKDRSNNSAATIDDELPLASVPKVVSGTLIALKVSEGVIGYDTTIGQVFPELARRYPMSPLSKATLRQLISHTSGLPAEPMKKGSIYQELECSFQDERVTEPGQKYVYSYGVNLAVAMVEHRVGLPLSEWVRGVSGQELGLHNLGHYEQNPGMARYFLDGEVVPYIQRPPQMNPSGSFTLSLSELLNFAKFTLEPSSTLPTAIYKQILNRASESLHSDTSASWHVASSGYLFHDGGLPGLFCSVRINPKSKTAFIWATNGNVRPGSPVASIGEYQDIQKEILSLMSSGAR
jgi:CubicO group peptidase (beta-lactamase class C family)